MKSFQSPSGAVIIEIAGGEAEAVVVVVVLVLVVVVVEVVEVVDVVDVVEVVEVVDVVEVVVVMPGAAVVLVVVAGVAVVVMPTARPTNFQPLPVHCQPLYRSDRVGFDGKSRFAMSFLFLRIY
jgi:hypothetical protein